jgi:Ca-activated chloride channel family protein
VLLARTHHALPERITVRGRLAGQPFERTYDVALDKGVAATLVPRLWAYEKMVRLLGDAESEEAHRGKIVELGLEYGIVTPFTSILALDSEQAYGQQGIRRNRSTLRGVKLTQLDAREPELERALIEQLVPGSGLAFGCDSREMSPAAASKSEQRPRDEEQGNMPGSPPPPPQMEVAAAPVAAATATAVAGDDLDQRNNLVPAEPSLAGAKESSGEADGFLDRGERAKGGAAALPKPARAAGPAGAPLASAPSTTTRTEPMTAGLLRDPADKKTKESTSSASRGWFRPPARPCSDVAKRPLAERMVLWWKRLQSANSIEEALVRYENANAVCELPDFRAKSALLELVILRVRTEGGAETLLAHFASEPETQRYVARGILRRAKDPAIAAVVQRQLFGGRRWIEIDNELAALKTVEERIARLREVQRLVPGDPQGDVRMVELLALAGQKDEALALGRRMREQGFLSPAVAVSLGDVLAKTGFPEDATRTYSEIVEFDPGSAELRRSLGDIYLRQGWFDAAYRQYATLTELAPSDAIGWLRLAAAASGAGRTDEALRMQRKVASTEGTPGPNDPRLFARLLSAGTMGRLLADPKLPKDQVEGITRKLKELQLLPGPSSLAIATWDDFDVTPTLLAYEPGSDVPLGELTESRDVGLSALVLPPPDPTGLRFVVRHRDDPPRRDVKIALVLIGWDGKVFSVRTLAKTLPPGAKEIAIP